MKISIEKLRNKWGSLSPEARAATAYAICSIVQKCIGFINMPIFTRLMTTDEYGEMTVYSSWSGIFSIILTLNLAYGSFSPAMLKFEKERDLFRTGHMDRSLYPAFCRILSSESADKQIS